MSSSAAGTSGSGSSHAPASRPNSSGSWQRIALQEQRGRWRAARAAFPAADLADATRKIEVAIDRAEAQLKQGLCLAGNMFTLADINLDTSCGIPLRRLFSDLPLPTRTPWLTDWLDRVGARPGVQAGLAAPGVLRGPADSAAPAARGMILSTPPGR